MIQFISTFLARFRSEDEEGQTLVEYGLLLALIAIIVIVALLFLGPIVSQIFQNVGKQPAALGSTPAELHREAPRASPGGFLVVRIAESALRSREQYHSHGTRPTSPVECGCRTVRRLLTAVTTLLTHRISSCHHPFARRETLREAIQSSGHPGRGAARRPRLRWRSSSSSNQTAAAAQSQTTHDRRPSWSPRRTSPSATRSRRTRSRTKQVDPDAVDRDPLRRPVAAAPASRPSSPIAAGDAGDPGGRRRGDRTPICISCQLEPGEKAIAFQVDRVTGLDFLIRRATTSTSSSPSRSRPPADGRLGRRARTRTPAALRGRSPASRPAPTVKTILQDKRVLYVSQTKRSQPAPTGTPTPAPSAATTQPPTAIDSVIIVFAGSDQDARADQVRADATSARSAR